jgi:signal transduction histidine kinase
MNNSLFRLRKRSSLSARLLLLTICFIMIAEITIYVPSISRFRLVYLQEKLSAGELASLALEATPDNMVSEELARDLLGHAGAKLVVRKGKETRKLLLGDYMPSEIAASYDLRDTSPPHLIMDAFEALISGDTGKDTRLIRVVGGSMARPDSTIEVVIDEGPMVMAMSDYSVRIMSLSVVISLITAALVFLSLHWMMVRPMRRLTASMVDFRENPQDANNVIAVTPRRDEIGIARRELAQMQNEIRDSLKQQERLAQLGTAVSKMSHDLRNILATAQLISDSIAQSSDPAVRKVTPTLVSAIDRAVDLCSHTLRFVRAKDAPLRLMDFDLSELADDLGGSLGLPMNGTIAWSNDIPSGFEINADRDEIYRAILNLSRNAVQAVQGEIAENDDLETPHGKVSISADRTVKGVDINFVDDGPGISEAAKAKLFKAFSGSAKAGGSGLGLAIANDIATSHGGELELVKTGSDGTHFRMHLPDA